MKYDLQFVKFAAESLFKLADAIEAEDAVGTPEEDVQVEPAVEVVSFKCDHCHHEAPLDEINEANSVAGAVDEVTAEDRVRCPECGDGIMSVTPVTEVEDTEEPADEEGEEEDTSDYLVKEASTMNLTPDQMGIVESVKKSLSPADEDIVNKILSGKTPLLNEILEQADQTGAMNHLEDATHFGFDGVNGAHKMEGTAVNASAVNVSKVISALLVAASLAFANGHPPKGSVMDIMNEYAKAHPAMQKTLHANNNFIKSLGEKAGVAVEHSQQAMKEKQEASKLAPLQDSPAPSSTAQAPQMESADVWKSAASIAIRNASTNSALLGRYMV